ncbi:MAG: hypothetical protein R6X20_14660 [Phycisphaerae bacterium]
MKRLCRWSPLVLAAAVFCAAPAEAACTATFTADDAGTFPETLRFDRETKRLTVDLSGLPAGATVFRAELILQAAEPHRQVPTEPTTVYPVGAPDERLAFAGPLDRGLACLEPVRKALAAGEPLRLVVETTLAGVARLEVSYLEGRPRRRLPKVTGVAVRHRAGQTFVTFREPPLADVPEFGTGADVAAFRASLAEAHPDLRFRVWRSAKPITAETIAAARLVGECGPLTCWNDTYHQNKTKKEPPVRYRVRDLADPLPWGTGVWVHNPEAAGRAHYAVTAAVAGEEDFDALAPAAVAGPVTETVGPGEPVLQWVEHPDRWMYRRGPLTRLIYTRWEAPPRSSTPSSPIDYLVAMGDDPPPEGEMREPQYRAYRVEPAPVGLHLHCWGGSLNGGYGWWYNAHRGAVLIASNQIPYDWWTGYHARRGTRRTWGDGGVHPYTMDRLFAFLDWAMTQHARAPEAVRKHWRRLDPRRVFVAGSSMGGSGAPMFAVRRGRRVAWALGWVGVHVPAESPQFRSSYRHCYGPVDAPVTMAGRDVSPWDWFSDVWWLRHHAAEETGLVIASNGKNDGGIGWPQALAFARALQETRRPHMFNWDIQGHGTHTRVGANFEIDVRTDRSLPAFTRCSLDDDPGTATPRPKEEIEAERERLRAEAKREGKNPNHVKVDPFDGEPRGAFNAHLAWETETIVDTPDRWEMTVVLQDAAPADRCTVDLTPRRLQRLRTPKGRRFTYTVTRPDGGKSLAEGEATADAHGLVTLEQIPLLKGRNRVIIAAAK